MCAVFGVVSLLVVLAIVGLLASRQLKAVGAPRAQATGQALPGAASAAGLAGNVREQSQQVQRQVADDIAKAMAQGARKDESGQ